MIDFNWVIFIIAFIGIISFIAAMRNEDAVWFAIYALVASVCLGAIIGWMVPVP